MSNPKQVTDVLNKDIYNRDIFMKRPKINILLFILSFLFSVNLFASDTKEINKTFSKKDELKIKLVLGSCHFKKSSDNNIHVYLTYTYDEENYEAQFKEKSTSIRITEKLWGSDNRGYSKWIISVPEDIEIDFGTATGEFIIDGLKKVDFDGNTGTGDIEIMNADGKFDLNTGTGRILVSDSEGEFELNTGTGDIKIEKSKGDFDANSGTGDVEATRITIEDEGDFSSGTGDIEIVHPIGTNYDLSLSSGTDDATLNMDGQPIEGYFEFTARSHTGRIVSPIDFDTEKNFQEGDNEYIRKSFTIGKKSPRFFISTGTGKAKLIR